MAADAGRRTVAVAIAEAIAAAFSAASRIAAASTKANCIVI